ncbi:MAG TPA: uracil-DNA glycosylase [Steroidobacter sp.]|jgi:DNA polymerase|nr:uracil-DNA glycosylase [Steroidobacteraceae bacterium]HLS79890.1 uracil-DNA glycosylase [Steroidobacter sp.]
MLLSYLKALEIDVWLPRDRPRVGSESPAGVEPISAASDADLRSAGSGRGWAELEAAVRDCNLCPLHATRTQAVFGVGDRTAQWMVIGEAPGMEEDRKGEPFVGRAGQLLNAMLKSVGLAREQVFIANILKSRPPNNRDPRPEEVRACLPYLQRQIELVNPRLILCVGRIAAQTLLQSSEPIGKLRGAVHRIFSDRPMVVTYHPAYLLRSPAEKRKAWADLTLALRTFRRLGGEIAS